MFIIVFYSKSYGEWVIVVILVIIVDISVVILLVVVCSYGISSTNSFYGSSIFNRQARVVDIVLVLFHLKVLDCLILMIIKVAVLR